MTKPSGEHCEIIDGARVRISDNATDADRDAISKIVAAAKRYIEDREGAIKPGALGADT